MTLSERINEINELTHGIKCAYQLFLDEMKEADRLALISAFENGVSQRVILRALRAEGYKTSNESINNHKSGNCKCQKN